MNVWLLAAAVVMLGFIPCGIVMTTAAAVDRLVALEMAAVVGVTALMLLAQGYHRSGLFDIALCIAVLSYPASLVFAHFLERWL